MSCENVTLLIIEDDEVDVEVIMRGISKRGLNFKIYAMKDGQRALEFLRSEIPHSQKNRLIVLSDINMPHMNGHQFVEALRADPELRRIIVMMLTSSAHERDKSRAYGHNVAGYFTKSNVDSLLDTLQMFSDCVEFPELAPSLAT
jgi:CheY-like chemotaxis protein